MAIVIRTTPTFVSPSIQAPISLANNVAGTLYKLDLRTARSATLLVRIGRTVATSLTRGGYVMIRNTDNDMLVSNSLRYDVIGQTATAVAPTVSSGGAVNTNTITLSSVTSINIGDTLCVSANSTERVEFARVFSISGSTITVEQHFKLSHNSGDTVTNFADDRIMVVDGGDIIYINCMNNSGQPLIFLVDAIIDTGDTII